MMSVASVADPATSQLAQDVAVIQAIESEVNQEVVESRDYIRILVLSVIARHHPYIAGEGGVGKSFGAERLMVRLPGVYWRTQFSKDMTRDELFGPPDIGALTNADGKGVRYERDVAGMMPEANLILGDEVADGSTMILRSLLNVLNERILRDGRRMLDLSHLWSFVGTGNFWIEARELAALFDRFAMRYVQPRVTSSEGFKQILRGRIERRANAGQSSVPLTKMDADTLARLHRAAATCVVPEDILTLVDGLRQKAEAENIVVSSRRMQAGLEIAQTSATMNGRTHVIEEDLFVYRWVLLNHPDDATTVADLTVEFAGKVAATVEGLRASYAEPGSKVSNLREQVEAGADKDPVRMGEITKEIGLLARDVTVIKDETEEKITAFQAEGRDVSELQAILRDIQADQTFMHKVVFG